MNFCKLLLISLFSFAAFGQNNTLTIGVTDIALSQEAIVNGQPVGFDIGLYCAIARILGKQIIFRQVSGVDDAFAQINAGTLDMFGGTVLVINNVRLAQFGFVRTDLAATTCLALLFNSPTPLADSIQGVLAINPAARFGSLAPGSIQYTTLLAAGVPPSQIISLEGVPLGSVAEVQSAFTTFALDAIYIFNTAVGNELVASSGGTLSDVPCVPLDQSVAGQGKGIAFNKQNCELMNQVQAALNIIIANGTYQALVQQQRNNPLLNPEERARAGVGFLIQPPINDSITNGFIPAACAGVAANLPLRSNLVNALLGKYCNTCNFIFEPLPITGPI